ncbi:MAG: HEAT repeat domain-containing protein [Candidatus Manganitrophus sp. SA1]|nr:HEAT repeat domain-containing protein [Candidatus Manganitrophus morganii]
MRSVQEDIAKRLTSPDVEVRLSALNALAGFPDASVIDPAITALGDSDWRVRKMAAAILLEGVDRNRIVHQLIDRLSGEKNIGMRNAAVEVFIQFGKTSVDPLLFSLRRTDDDVKKLIIDTLGEIKERKAVPPLVALFSDQNENIAASAVEALGKIGDPVSVPPLLEILTRENPLLVFSAVKALEQIGDSRAVEPLIGLLAKNPYRRAGLEALGAMGDMRVLEALTAALQSGSKSIRCSALKAIAALESRQSTTDRAVIHRRVKEVYQDSTCALLDDAVQDADSFLRRAAIRMYGWVAEARSVSILIPLINSECREEALSALVSIGKEHIEPLIAGLSGQDDVVREVMATVFGRIGERRVVPALLELLQDRSGHVRQSAAAALGEVGDPGTIGALLPVLTDVYPNVQESAVKALLQMKETLPRTTLLDYLRHDSSALRSNAAFLLGRVREEKAIAPLRFLLSDPEQSVRKAAVAALGCFHSPEVSQHILLALGDESADVRLAALKILAGDEIGHLANLADTLHPLVHDENIWVRSAIPPILARVEEEKARTLLLELLSDRVGAVKISTLSVLGERREKWALPLILAETNNPDLDVKKAAILALGLLSEPSVVPLLQSFLSDLNWTVRVASIRAIGRLRDRSSILRLKEMADSDSDPMVRETARQCLSQIESESGPMLIGNE